jgi:regulator of sigma E protease
LLPLPALDGGHFILLLYEGLRGKPLGAKAMHHIQTVGIAIILAITIFSTFKDITR